MLLITSSLNLNTFLFTDRDFAHIEQHVQGHENIYSMDQYQDIMHGSVQKSPFAVNCMSDKFYDLQCLPQVLELWNVKQNTSGEQIQFRDNVPWIRTDTFSNYKHSLSKEQPWKVVQLHSVEVKYTTV